MQDGKKSLYSRTSDEAQFIHEVKRKMHDELKEYEHSANDEVTVEELTDLNCFMLLCSVMG